MAAGSLLALWTPFNGEPPTANYTPLAWLVAATGLRPFRSFDGTTDQSCIYTAVMPPSYSGRGATAKAWLGMSGANTGTKIVKLGGQFERDEAGVDLRAGGNDFAGAQTSETTVDNSTNFLFTATIGFTNGAQMDSVVAGDLFRFRIVRNNAGTTGTNATGAANLFALAIYES